MIDRKIKFRHVQCFVEIAREKSFKRAAEKLHLTQPAISKTLRELEELVGARLLTRSRSGVELSDQGAVFLHFAQLSLSSIEQGLQGIVQEGRALQDTLLVGALPSVAARLLPEATAEFIARAPNATLQIVDGPHGYLVDLLRTGRLDLVIGRMGAPDSMQGISFTQLYTEQVAIVVRPGHPLLLESDLRRMVEWPIIYPPEGSAIRPLVEGMMIANGLGILPHRIESVSGAFGRVYTLKNDAVWFISRGVVARDIKEGTLARLPVDMGLTLGPVGLMARAGEQYTPVQQVFQLSVETVLPLVRE